MKKLTKYNLGFKWFGPLEQCNDGKFYLVSEVDQQWAINEWDLKHRISYLENSVKNHQEYQQVCHQTIADLTASNKQLKKHNRIKRRILILMSIIFVLLGSLKYFN